MKIKKFINLKKFFDLRKSFGIIIALNAVIFPSYSSEGTFSKPTNTQSKNISTDYLEKSETQEYILGSGDLIEIKVAKSGTYKTISLIDATGKINLPEINYVYVEGLSIIELTDLLNQKYSTILNNPNVQISIPQYRPIKVYLDGEIRNPGLYEFEIVGSSGINGTNPSGALRFPTLFDAIKESGGITNYADLSAIEIIRLDTISNGGGKIKAEINFLDFFDGEDNSSNIRLYDGDLIRLKKTNLQLTGQISKALQSNLNPKFMNVIVNGQVERGGKITINKNSTLNDAILYAGGFKAGKGSINIISYQTDGNLNKKQLNYNPKAQRGSASNPKLFPGDVILVGKNSLKRTDEIIGNLTNPFAKIISIYSGIKIIND
tara:strand:- start:30085 stop:31215 length:1131 start_codon:yes stop_codon:yes gene_type:complete